MRSIILDYMHDSLKKIVVPELRSRKFKGSYPDFKRIGTSQIDLINFQFDKYGQDLFVINLAQKPVTDDLSFVPMQFRLQPKLCGGSEGWFNFSSENYDDVAHSVLPYIERADQWFANTSDTEGLYPPVIRKPSDKIDPAISDRNQREYDRLIAGLAARVEDYKNANPESELRMDVLSAYCAKVYSNVFICCIEVAYIILPANGAPFPGLRVTTPTRCLEFRISSNGEEHWWFTTDLPKDWRRLNGFGLTAYIFEKCILPSAV